MSPADPITVWIHQLKAGDRAAVGLLWERYFEQLVRLAQKRLAGVPQRASDGEDVALSAFASFCRAAEEGRLPKLLDRDSLWSHLFNYARRKAHYLIKRTYAQIRGGGNEVNASALDSPDGRSFLADVLGGEPTSDAVAAFLDHYRALFEQLPTPELRSVAQWRLEGLTSDEIAKKIGRDPRTVERKLSLIRSHWQQEEDA